MSQKEKKKLVSIKTDDTLMETALHGTHLFPYKLYDDNITDYDFNCIDWHWHTEFEFVYIESGIVHFNVGEDNFDMSEGQGIFINSKVVHKMHSENDAVIPNFLLSSVSDCSERKFNLSEICVTLSELIFGLLHFFFFTGMAERNFV